mmetsp:Transcript_119176/g.344749  ORF Transcript_119176/g.344749 Transcript_119176/m.344749 type:complete len:395 (-) Transcript_119176:82-1266(-)
MHAPCNSCAASVSGSLLPSHDCRLEGPAPSGRSAAPCLSHTPLPEAPSLGSSRTASRSGSCSAEGLLCSSVCFCASLPSRTRRASCAWGPLPSKPSHARSPSRNCLTSPSFGASCPTGRNAGKGAAAKMYSVCATKSQNGNSCSAFSTDCWCGSTVVPPHGSRTSRRSCGWCALGAASSGGCRSGCCPPEGKSAALCSDGACMSSKSCDRSALSPARTAAPHRPWAEGGLSARCSATAAASSVAGGVSPMGGASSAGSEAMGEGAGGALAALREEGRRLPPSPSSPEEASERPGEGRGGALPYIASTAPSSAGLADDAPDLLKSASSCSCPPFSTGGCDSAAPGAMCPASAATPPLAAPLCPERRGASVAGRSPGDATSAGGAVASCCSAAAGS